MTQLTCLACRTIFDDAEAQRSHYKSDWHRYNLKRKIAEMPPVTYGEFNRIVRFHTEKREEKKQEKHLSCQICSKSFSSENAHTNHMNSKKHKEQMKKEENNLSRCHSNQSSSSSTKTTSVRPKPGYMPPVESYNAASDDDDSDEWEDVDEEDEDGQVEEIDDDEESEALPPMFCFFCPHESVNIEDNFRHMSKSHSFFIPDFKYIVDLEGFFIYLGAKVGDGKVCLKCNNHSRQFATIRACQMHMTDKGHCMLDTENDAMLEFSDFYDFSTSYPDQVGDEDVDNELSAAVGALDIDDSTMELILPSGARAGHRALNRYYKQSISLEERQTKNRRLIAGIDNHVRTLGLSGNNLSLATRKKIHARKVEHEKRSDYRLRVSVKANKLQKYFRKQTEGGG